MCKLNYSTLLSLLLFRALLLANGRTGAIGNLSLRFLPLHLQMLVHNPFHSRPSKGWFEFYYYVHVLCL